ncbi:transglutaminase-like domain-containing protein [Streptomyces sp. NPDC059755]|uniref:transglutaminase-like domain-containing protein n=1 Tax=Streptomyces sp. NPDC059755 TaxID=3346934 RepID=UPI00365B4467
MNWLASRCSSYDEQFVGTCRDYSLLLCSLLRATGTPSRIRCGYAPYFAEGFQDDHWVTEYRLPDGTRRLADAQVSAAVCEVPFDPMDVPRDGFLVAGQAWRAWGRDALTEDELALVDAVAAAPAYEEARRLYADPRLVVSREILSLAPFHGLRTVTLASSPPV